jgi:hypothetical protein
MQDNKEVLEKYLRLEINNDELLNSIGEKKRHDSTPLVTVTMDDLRRVVGTVLENRLTKLELSKWVDFVWFSGYYDYEDKNQEAIAQVMNDLEDNEQLSDSEYKNRLSRINTDISQGNYPRNT